MNHTSDMMHFIDEASKCDIEPDDSVYPVDLAKEYAQLHRYIYNKKSILKNSKSQQVQTLVKVVDKLEKKLEDLSKLSLGAFLRDEN